MNKLYIKRITGIIIAIFLILFMYIKISEIVRQKDPEYCKSTFKENADDIDILFFGTSHMINAVFPIELWNNYGIASYNMAGHGNTVPNSYWIMINALDYADPELIVIDCLGISNTEKTSENYFHWSMDSFNLSKNKINAVNDLFNDPLKRYEYLFDFSLYHNRWNELSEVDFEHQQYVQYGAQLRTAVAVPKEIIDINNVNKKEIDTYGTEYLKKMIEECQNRNIKVLLTYLPFPASEEDMNESLAAEDIANEYGVDYLNFLEMDIVDYNTDCYDDGSHLNPSGAEKVTDYIGNYIQKNYMIEDKRGDKSYHDWNENYKLYTSLKIDMLKEESNLLTYLMLLRNQDISICLYIKGGSSIYENKVIYQLINNIPIYNDLEKMEEAVASEEDYFMVVSNKKVWEYVNNEDDITIDLLSGKISYSNTNDNKKMYLEGFNNSNLYESNDIASDIEIQIYVIDDWTGSIIDTVKYAKNSDIELIRD
ncbi:MAG: hypothetical protein NC314_00260 [Roseburia sp.]|nr:hypothetical protein [Roseburia sp.]